MTCSSPFDSLEVFWGVIFGFVSHMVDIAQLSVPVCLCPFAERVVSIYFCNFEFSMQLGEF